MDLSVILPTYNERQNIVILIEEIKKELKKVGRDYEILIIDDNSPDGTADLLKEKFYTEKNIRVIKRLKERGLATAVKEGIKMAQGKMFLVMDTDFNHDPKYIPIMFNRIDQNDIVLGSRYVMGGGMEGAQLRFILSGLFNLFIRVTLNLKTKDNLSGFLFIKKTSWQKISNLETIIFKGYGEFCIRLLYYASSKGLKIEEIPVFYKERLGGKSKTIFLKHLIDYTLTVLRLMFEKEI